MIDMDIENISSKIGKRLSERRKFCQMTQRDLAKKVGVTLRQQQKYEAGTNKIDSSRLFLFSKILNVSISYFFEDNDLQNSFSIPEIDNHDVRQLVSIYLTLPAAVQRSILGLLKDMKINSKILTTEEA